MSRPLLHTAAAAAAWAALGLATAPLPAQPRDWDDAVAKACEHPRYGMRRAVSGEIAAAGDAAVPAVRAWASAHGNDRVPLLLVDAIAADTRGEAVVALLEEWARDRAFFWRAQALGGLARRRLPRLRPLYLDAVRDPSHLYRIEGARGLFLLDPERDRGAIDALAAADPDPRVRLRLAALLAEHGDRRFLGVLAAALDLRAEFLGDPWGRREAQLAAEALRPLLGDVPAAADAASPGSAAELRAALRARYPEELARAEAELVAPDRAFAGGLAVRSCRNGDLFLRWTAEGEVFAGLLPARGVRLAAPVWEALAARLGAAAPGENQVHGKVICDFLELASAAPARRLKSAPGALPAPASAWLLDLAAALRATADPALADELSGRLEQFAGPADK